MKLIVFAAAGLAALAALDGCSSTATLDPAAQAAVTNAYNAICPAVSPGGLDAIVATLNQNTQNAYAAAKQICSAGAPTNVVVAGLDIVTIEPLLAPYTSKIKIKVK
jgi:hypothetical protein